MLFKIRHFCTCQNWSNLLLILRVINFLCFSSQWFRGARQGFSSPEAALLLVSTKNCDLWPGPTTEVRDSQTSRHFVHAQSQVWPTWLVLVSIYCVYKSIQNRNVVGPGQRSRFLVLTKRSPASRVENARQDACEHSRSRTRSSTNCQNWTNSKDICLQTLTSFSLTQVKLLSVVNSFCQP